MTVSPELAMAACLAVMAGCAARIGPHESPTTVAPVSYTGSNGERVQVMFLPDSGTAVLLRDDQRFDLPQQPAASGFWYSDGRHGIRGKGEELQIETGRMAPLPCRAAGS